MSKGPERGRQDEASAFLSRYGVAHKVMDATPCPRCKTLVRPARKGEPDYACSFKGYSTIIELKAGYDRIEFAQFSIEQREHLAWWIEANRGYGMPWVLVITGAERVDSASALRKRAWMVNWGVWTHWETTITEAEGVKYIPTYISMNMRFKNPQLTLDYLGASYELRWVPSVGWDFPAMHPAKVYYNL